MEKLNVRYLEICPIDRNDANFEEIYNYGLCNKDYERFKKTLFKITENLDLKEDLENFNEDYIVLQKLKEFINFFKENTGHQPLRLQLYWAKRVLKRESFSIIAPTGIGKTTFGNIISHFLPGKVYYLVPSKILLREIEKKLKNIKSDKKILIIKEKEDKELLKNEDFDILLTTANFLHKNFDIIPKNFDLVFVDDADSLIRQPKNIDKVLKLIKFKDEEIQRAIQIIDKKRKAKNREDYAAIEVMDINKDEKGLIIAASATLTPKTKKIALFRELLGFEIGSATTYLRNIEEVYEIINGTNGNNSSAHSDSSAFVSAPSDSSQKIALIKRSIYWLKKLGPGGFVFLNDDFRKEDLNNYIDFLKENSINAVSYEKFNTKNQKAFLENEIQVVVGFSNIRNPLTRGIDLPQKVRYALFLGVPKFKIPLKVSYSPLHLFLLGLTLRETVDEKSLIERNLNFLKKISFLKEEAILADKNLKEKIEPIKRTFEEFLKDEEIIEKIKKHPRITLMTQTDANYTRTNANNNGVKTNINSKENNHLSGNHPGNISSDDPGNNLNYYLVVSDPRGYIQASGRTSRLFPLGLTKGLALILAENEKVLNHLKDKLKILGYEANFKNASEINLTKILEEIDKDRKIVERVLTGEEFTLKDPIETALVLVESPTKAKTIANFFGKPARRIKANIIFYEVSLGNLHLNICATLGHFTDLTHQDGYYGVKKEKGEFVPVFQPLKICQNCKRHLSLNENECPVCNSQNFLSKQELIKNLQKIAFEVDKIYLATDPDTEGEKIAFDLFAYLYPYNQNIKRIELHEITKTEFIKKIKEPRDVDVNLVKAQLLRRISDRWIGFKLSEEIQQHFKNLNLSAGRVQTPVLGWILEKEKRIKNKHYLVNVSINQPNDSQKLTPLYFYLENEDIIKEIKTAFKNQELEIEIKFNRTQEETINPLPPYDTSNLLKDANSFFRFEAPITMRLAQDLFEQGLITYHRTDSVFVSEFGRNVAYEYLERKNLKDLFYKRAWGEIGTHEGIRPTKPLDVQDLIESMILEQKNLTKKHLQLYGLIFNRFIASQMKPSKGKKTEIEIILKTSNHEFVLYKQTQEAFVEITEGNHLQFFKNIKIFNLIEDKFKVENLKIKKVPKEYHYTQGELIDEMKKRGLGRPSTYSTIIQTLIDRKYVLNRSGYLIPVSLGEKIYNYLIKKHKDLVAEEFTIKLEEAMDLVAEGKKDYQKILNDTFKRVFQ
ncbi:MAG: reverse gyrase 2 [Candidatus Parcubacteria bacterium]|nr:MAG: reverse gyrase 2 [Candidatus Parcubacteria bacterium]